MFGLFWLINFTLQVDRGRQNTRSEAHMKDKAQEIMKTIEKKLNGQMGKMAHAKLPISTEGQVIIEFAPNQVYCFRKHSFNT